MISVEEVKAAVSAMKAGKAAGPSGVVHSFIHSFFTRCEKWIHKTCSKVKGKIMSNVDFQCPKCIGRLKQTRKVPQDKAKLVLDGGVEFKCVDRFCYLGDMIGAGGGADLASK